MNKELCGTDVSIKPLKQLNHTQKNLLYYEGREKRMVANTTVVPRYTNKSLDSFILNETNLSATISTYYLRTDPLDIINSLSFSGIPGGINSGEYFTKIVK